MLGTWLSHDDFEQLVVRALTAPLVGHTVLYGMSNNIITWWDNARAKHLGWVPQDSSDAFRASREAAEPTLDLADPAVIHQGGGFLRIGPFEN